MIDWSTIPPFFCSTCLYFRWRVKRCKVDNREVSRTAYCIRVTGKEKPCSEALTKTLEYSVVSGKTSADGVVYLPEVWVDNCVYWLPADTDELHEADVSKKGRAAKKERMLKDFLKLSKEKKERGQL